MEARTQRHVGGHVKITSHRSLHVLGTRRGVASGAPEKWSGVWRPVGELGISFFGLASIDSHTAKIAHTQEGQVLANEALDALHSTTTGPRRRGGF